jgi:predicted negative regulator of RcsB-dependent stress response
MPLGAVVMVAALAGQPAAPVRSPYLDAVRRYAAGSEPEAVLALRALRLDHADQAFAELDRRICVAAGARSCAPRDLGALARDARARLLTTWRRLYPRALAIHVEALASCDPATEHGEMDVHRAILVRLAARVDEIAREPGTPAAFAALPATARHLLLWTLQLLRDEPALAATLEAFEASGPADAEIELARADLEELRARPDALTAAVQVRTQTTSQMRDTTKAQVEAFQLERAARIYERLLAADPSNVEASLRLGRVLVRLDKLDAAQAQLQRAARLAHDPRQAYLVALFLGDVAERQGRSADATTSYAAAQRHWPGAQASAISFARLRALAGATAQARDALKPIALAPEAAERSDPWHGYDGGQSWQLPGAVRALQLAFEALE